MSNALLDNAVNFVFALEGKKLFVLGPKNIKDMKTLQKTSFPQNVSLITKNAILTSLPKIIHQ